MEKKRFKMYKKGKNWLIAPIIFLGVLSAIGFATDNTEVHADEIETPQVHQVVEEVPVSSESLEISAEKVSAPL
ncbi:MAG: KxYKxGKxW signal peptide domain-containing protein, partial [Enterococcus hulanensis]